MNIEELQGPLKFPKNKHQAIDDWMKKWEEMSQAEKEALTKPLLDRWDREFEIQQIPPAPIPPNFPGCPMFLDEHEDYEDE